jgi:hypothetical protein
MKGASFKKAWAVMRDERWMYGPYEECLVGSGV